MWRESGPGVLHASPSLQINTHRDRSSVHRERPCCQGCLSVCLSVPSPRGSPRWAFTAPRCIRLKGYSVAACIVFFFFGTYMGQVDGNPDLGENVALSIFERFSYPVFISICLQINTLLPLTLPPPPFFFFFPYFLFFSFLFHLQM